MVRRLPLLLGLALAPAAMAAKDKKAETKPAATAAATSSSAPKPPDEKARAAAFADYDAEKASGQKARAADALVALIDDPARAAFHAEAYGKLGETLDSLDLPYSALVAFTKGFLLADDLSAPIVGLHVPRAVELADKAGDLGILQEPFSKNLALARTEDVRGRMAYLAAREAFRRDEFGMAGVLLKMVKEGDPVYPEAKLLEGVMLNQQGRPDDALTPFEKALAAGRDKPLGFRDLASLNVARSFYAAGNFPRAIQGYAAVSRGSEFWPEAQYERAWAHFRIDDFNGSLGVLMSLQTPFFADWYFPEADLLRIYSAFLMCKFPQANEELEAFKVKYAPLAKQLDGVAGKSGADMFELGRQWVQKGETSGLPIAVLRPFKGEERFEGAIVAVQRADDELKRMKGGASANPFTERARDWLQARRDAIVKEEGERLRDRIAGQAQDLSGMVTDADIFSLDVLRMQSQLYEQAAIRGKMEAAARTVKREDKPRKGWREWPYEGEDWADELGYYRIEATPECPVSMQRGK